MRAAELIETFGPEVARRMAELYGGSKERLPTLRMIEVSMRRAAIYDAWRAGWDARRISLHYDVSEDYVRGAVRLMERTKKAI